LYDSPNTITVIKSRRMRWAVHIAHMGKMINAYSILIGNPEGKRPLGRPSRRWEDNIRMGVRERDCEGMDWIHLAQDSYRWRVLVNAEMKLWVP
jgi:hypothetical protein